MNLRVNNRQEKELATPHPELGGETWLTANSLPCSQGEGMYVRTMERADPSNPVFQRSSVTALTVPLQWVKVTETKARCSLQLRAQQSPVSGMQNSFRATLAWVYTAGGGTSGTEAQVGSWDGC